jgi:hypothetical protein
VGARKAEAADGAARLPLPLLSPPCHLLRAGGAGGAVGAAVAAAAVAALTGAGVGAREGQARQPRQRRLQHLVRARAMVWTPPPHTRTRACGTEG